MRPLVTRLFGFFSLPLISAVTPLLILPVVARTGGPAGWTAVILGQSIGMLSGSFLASGWNIAGPPLMVSRTHDQGLDLYAHSIRMRAGWLLASLPVQVLLAWVLSPPGERPVTIMMSLASSLIGLSPSWYFIGLGRPAPIAVYETVPRLVAAALAVPLVIATRTVAYYPCLLVALTLIGLGALHFRLYGRLFPARPGRSDDVDLRAFWLPRLVEVSGVAYASFPVPISRLTASIQETSALASADRLYRFGLFAITALGNALQGWVLDARGRAQGRRQSISILLHLGLGLAGLIFLWVAGPELSALLFGRDLMATRTTMVLYGLTYLMISLSTPLMRNLLAPSGRYRSILVATLASLAGGAAAMTVGGARYGSEGVAGGLLVSETLLVLMLLAPALEIWLGLRRADADAERVSPTRRRDR